MVYTKNKKNYKRKVYNKTNTLKRIKTSEVIGGGPVTTNSIEKNGKGAEEDLMEQVTRSLKEAANMIAQQQTQEAVVEAEAEAEVAAEAEAARAEAARAVTKPKKEPQQPSSQRKKEAAATERSDNDDYAVQGNRSDGEPSVEEKSAVVKLCNWLTKQGEDTFFEKQEQGLGCGRHALNNLFKFKFFIRENVTYDFEKNFKKIKNGELDNNIIPFPLNTFCKNINDQFAAIGLTGDEQYDCDPNEYYNIELFIAGLNFFGYHFQKKVNKTMSENHKREAYKDLLGKSEDDTKYETEEEKKNE